jgi:CubicO group peptidase (beta-lactamase class C family)
VGTRASSPVAEALAAVARWEVGFASAAVIAAEREPLTTGDTATVVRIASVSKPLVAYAGLIAVEEGTLDLDEPLNVIGGASVPAGLTVRHLMAHAGGYAFDTDERLGSVGQRRMYSNTGFDLFAAFLAERSGLAVDRYVGDAVFGPLGMTSTALRGSPAKDVWSNVNDLTKFAAELLQPTLVAPTTFAEFTSSQFPELSGVVPGVGRFDPCPWGLGVEIRGTKSPHWTGTTNSEATFGHFGGSGTFLWVDPNAQGGPLALVCLTDREFGPWSLACWPTLSDGVLGAAVATG